jgi:hypothetical protein
MRIATIQLAISIAAWQSCLSNACIFVYSERCSLPTVKESLKPRLELGAQTHDALRPACPTSSASESDVSSLVIAFWYFFNLWESFRLVRQHELKWFNFPQELHCLPIAGQVSCDTSYPHLRHFCWLSMYGGFVTLVFFCTGFSLFLKGKHLLLWRSSAWLFCICSSYKFGRFCSNFRFHIIGLCFDILLHRSMFHECL